MNISLATPIADTIKNTSYPWYRFGNYLFYFQMWCILLEKKSKDLVNTDYYLFQPRGVSGQNVNVFISFTCKFHNFF